MSEKRQPEGRGEELESKNWCVLETELMGEIHIISFLAHLSQRLK